MLHIASPLSNAGNGVAWVPRLGAFSLCAVSLFAFAAAAQVDPLSGIDFVTVGAVGNAPYTGPDPYNHSYGFGQVNHEYRIGRTEVTTAQWVEFYNAAFDRPQSEWIGFIATPSVWGAGSTAPNTPGGRRWSATPASGLRPVGGISWRTAAIYANWLHNGKSLEREAFLTGSYEVSSFGYFPGTNIWSDQFARSPGARYFIPSYDEWLKAAHYDPSRVNDDGTTGGWWAYSNGTDAPLIGGVPGTGQANFGFSGGYTIPLGSYPQTRSPWGLLDMAGATSEWSERVGIESTGLRHRFLDGSRWNSGFNEGLADAVYSFRANAFPDIPSFSFGLRMAAVVPAPGVGVFGVGLLLWHARRRQGGLSMPSATTEPLGLSHVLCRIETHPRLTAGPVRSGARGVPATCRYCSSQ